LDSKLGKTQVITKTTPASQLGGCVAYHFFTANRAICWSLNCRVGLLPLQMS